MLYVSIKNNQEKKKKKTTTKKYAVWKGGEEINWAPFFENYE